MLKLILIWVHGGLMANFIYFLQQSFFSPVLQGHGQSLTHSQPFPHPVVVQVQSVKSKQREVATEIHMKFQNFSLCWQFLQGIFSTFL